MNRTSLFVTAALAIVTFIAGCSKTVTAPSAQKTLLTTHTWITNARTINGVADSATCRLSDQYTFSSDGTGSIFRPILCSSLTDTSTRTFDFSLASVDNTTLFIHYTAPIHDTDITWNITHLDATSLQMQAIEPVTGNTIVQTFTGK